MTTIFVDAPSMVPEAHQTRGGAFERVEGFLDAERDQLPLWLPVAGGCGIGAWFVIPGHAGWLAWLLAMAGIGVASLLLPAGSRMRRAVLLVALASTLGCAAVWARATWLASPVLGRPVVVQFDATVQRIEVQAAKERFRVTLAPVREAGLPKRVRVVVDNDKAPAKLTKGERVSVRARLIGPGGATVPGGFDFSRVAWFQQLGATGKAIGPMTRKGPVPETDGGLRERLAAHVRKQIDGSAGGIASAFATGDRGGIAKEDEDAMRASGLTHLLSISGLHVTAVVGAVMFLTLRLMAASMTLALRWPLLTISAGAGAAAGVGYTLLTGAEVPTVRSCVAALLILIGIALGREAFTLRLVATGAIIVLLLWPEALVGPSFQLSFAAITSIVALHEHPAMRRVSGPGDDGLATKLARGALALLITGVVVELTLAPIVLFHFHKSGLYGAFANIIAIPLTTFVIMPLEAGALLLDVAGLGAPLWWLTGGALEFLLWMARTVAVLPGAMSAVASVPTPAFAAMIAGGLWLMLWKGRVRQWGLVPIAAGALWALGTPAPDILVTGDGMHMAVRDSDGTLGLLRPKAGDYVRSVLAERSGTVETLGDLDDLEGVRCGTDACRIDLLRDGRTWRVLATRSRYLLPARQLRTDCAAADIVVSSRWLPEWCRPRWFKADRDLLARTGGIAVNLAAGRVETVAQSEGKHPWVLARHLAIQESTRSGP